MEAPKKKTTNTSDHLSNERTFLAWSRTGVALMGLGFVIVKFALFVRELSSALGSIKVFPVKGYSAVVGVLMVALGAVITGLAYFRYRIISQQIENEAFYPTKWPVSYTHLDVYKRQCVRSFKYDWSGECKQ